MENKYILNTFLYKIAPAPIVVLFNSCDERVTEPESMWSGGGGGLVGGGQLIVTILGDGAAWGRHSVTRVSLGPHPPLHAAQLTPYQG